MADWPPFPHVIMGKGQWLKLLRLLDGQGSKGASELARKIRAQIEADAERIGAEVSS